jgi:hypothetical protein
MRRRELIAFCSAAAWPFHARAQQTERIRRIGLIFGGSKGSTDALLSVFAEAVRKHGSYPYNFSPQVR